MPEIKHTFQAGKMNKDLDERLVPNGEYRDALNIQVRTTDGDAVGTVQNIKGNSEIGTTYYNSTWMVKNPMMVVGSVADEKNDKVYFFFSSHSIDGIPFKNNSTSLDPILSERIYIDSIIEQDIYGNDTPIVIDRYAIINTKAEVFGDSPYMDSSFTDNGIVGSYTEIQVLDASKYRVGMTIEAKNENGLDLFTTDGGPAAKIKAINTTTNIITLYEEQDNNLLDAAFFVFKQDRVLNFSGNIITGINIIDNLLFWTDNLSEPKKINIDRCRDGTTSFTTQPNHTKLHVKNYLTSTQEFPQYTNISNIDGGSDEFSTNSDLKEEHITVIRKAPRTAPTIHMKETEREGKTTATVPWTVIVDGFDTVSSGDIRGITNDAFIDTYWRTDDILRFTQSSDVEGGDPVELKAKFICYEEPNGGSCILDSSSNTIRFRMLYNNDGVPDGSLYWDITLDEQKPLFELKFGRFGYRYKYEDGECSSFSPWSEIAFLPGKFDYIVKKGYNLGMVNNVRELIIKDFIPYKKPLDVVAVDVLWKAAGQSNVYVVKTITRVKDSEWELFTPGSNAPQEEVDGVVPIKSGQITITSEMIHRVLPSSQLLRAWDNVPRTAKAQEITANRLLYANYTQGFDLKFPVSLTQHIKSESTPTLTTPKKSVKSIRNYKFGMVFGDKYGRETPVVSSGYAIEISPGRYESLTGDLSVGKSLSSNQNSFELEQQWDSLYLSTGANNPPSYFDYVKYYIKETSNEYYNLIVDRWYWADEEENNVWLSFPSADRNKVDEETYLILKNQHGNQTPVEDKKARFKIIAISNDAPKFIKTIGNTIGDIVLYPTFTDNTMYSDGLSGGPASNSTDISGVEVGPDALMNNRQMTIRMNVWSKFIGSFKTTTDDGSITWNLSSFSDNIWGRRLNSDGSVRVRVRGENSAGKKVWSGWRSIYSYRFVNTDMDLSGDLTDAEIAAQEAAALTGAKIEIHWDKAWGDEANMYEKFYNIGLTGLKMYLEFEEEVVTHKPEFDGRFFVKIEKNTELENNVISSNIDSAETEYIPQGSPHKIVYIDSQEENPADVFADAVAGTQTWNDPDGNFTASNVEDQFADCEYNFQTEEFWDDHVSPQNIDFTNGVSFLDGARARFMKFNDVSDSDAIGYKPEALEAGTATEGMGRMHISYLPNTQGSSAGVALTSSLSSVGTKFQFTDDTYNQIYQVISAVYAINEFGQPQGTVYNYGEYDSTDDDCGECSLTSGNTAACKRITLRVDFRKLDQTTNTIYPNVGLETLDWDPRGAVVHWGDQNSVQKIQIMQQSIVGGAGSHIGDGACMETEPKEDTDLDLYYEASNAIPMVLNEENCYDYAPINSKVRATRQDDDNNWPAVGLGDTTDHKVSAINFLNDSPLISFTSINTLVEGAEPALHISGIEPGDILHFEHNDGTETSAEVKNHYVPSSTPVTEFTTFSLARTYYFDMVLTTNLLTETDVISITGENWVLEDLEIGMLVLGLNSDAPVPIGTTITSVTVVDATTAVVTLSDISWMQLGNCITGINCYNIVITDRAGYFEIDRDAWKHKIKLAWFNCYAWGNGVESDRIRDDFNAPQIDNGVKVSTTFSGYGEEKIGSGLIYSGLYNSTSQVNDLSEFNMAEKITKNLNPSYGSIQALKTRDTDVVVLTEDKVLKVLSSKDALFNADGSPQLTATNKVLGTAIPFVGDYGISKNPESLNWDQFRIYFTDKQRGAVLRLSRDGLTPISNVGMKTWFRDNLKRCSTILGTFDSVNGEYNVTLNYKTGEPDTYSDTTVSFNEGSKGWVSFKSFVPQAGRSISGKYITAINHGIYEHYSNNTYNNFYGTQYESSVKVLFNDSPSDIKSFKAVNYEGSQSRVIQHTQSSPTDAAGNTLSNITDGEYYNLTAKEGWYVNSFETDLQSGSVPEFINKENKWFNKINGVATTYNNYNPSISNVDTNEFTTQGIGMPVTAPTIDLGRYKFTVKNYEDDSSATINTD